MLRMKVTWSEQYMKQYGDPEALMTKAVLGIMKKAVDADVSQQHGDLSKAEAGLLSACMTHIAQECAHSSHCKGLTSQSTHRHTASLHRLLLV